jgi:hypothetical protein
MIDIKILENNDEYLEFELTQPNDLQGDTSEWDNDDWNYWNTKMAELEANGTKGELETKIIRLDKKPFIDGTKFFQASNSEKKSTGDIRRTQRINEEFGEYTEYNEQLSKGERFNKDTNYGETSGSEIQPE